MTLDGTWTYVVGRDRPVVIDPGPADERHRDAVLSLLGGVEPAAIVLTHAHPDHAGGATALAGATGGPLRMARGAPRSAVPDEAMAGWLADGDRIESDAGPLTVLATPGHAPEHIALVWHPVPGDLRIFVGDLMMGSGDTTLVAPPEGDLRLYLGSLERLAALRPTTLYPAHGDPIAAPAAAIARYRRHREERIEQVRRFLRDHPDAGLDRAVDSIYGVALDPRLRAAARGSVEAMVRYLREPT